uniref:Uncharacterized protein n=1 Tax=Eutreptiella gymnastica TaxID=73025 RepID=A0A7S4GHP8_9EUGL|mmetsp:Transcript_54627/g.90109  ORF Transcript_54627/g.90109 Transcript_54627/m.90109 type:complete len:144 (+) Transcript_54627:156-587(+)
MCWTDHISTKWFWHLNTELKAKRGDISLVAINSCVPLVVVAVVLRRNCCNYWYGCLCHWCCCIILDLPNLADRGVKMRTTCCRFHGSSNENRVGVGGGMVEVVPQATSEGQNTLPSIQKRNRDPMIAVATGSSEVIGLQQAVA